MTDFENEMRRALRREDPPADFAGRVMARLGQRLAPPEPARWWQWLAWPRWAMAMAIVALMVTGGVRYQEYRRGQQAKEQLLTALRITAETLSVVDQKLEEATRRSGLQ